MSWKCDKCKNTYSNDVEPTKVAGFQFCPHCLGVEDDVQPIKKRADVKKIVIAIMVAALIVLVGAAVSAVMLFISNQIPAAITAATCGFVAVVILTSVSDSVRKRNRDVFGDDKKGKKRK
ncbi:MAG: hypothetical protein IJJ41_00165 [Clostridia bacterium]|nr:hypothetical protein [Clostridia bacterium]